eukprot:12820866-Alexandrium_andersonii.AAC.1
MPALGVPGVTNASGAGGLAARAATGVWTPRSVPATALGAGGPWARTATRLRSSCGPPSSRSS